MRKRLIAIFILLPLVLVLSSCGDWDDEQDIAVRNGFHGCLYGDSVDRGYDLEEEYDPSDGKQTVHDQTVLREIPSTNRFLNISNTPGRDPGQPRYLTSRDMRGVGVWLELQIRFRFVSATSCEWYTNHGGRSAPGGPFTRDVLPEPPPGRVDTEIDDTTRAAGGGSCGEDIEAGDMGFNARGGCVTSWFTYLRENFTTRAQAVILTEVSNFGWEALVRNGAIESGPNQGELTWDVLGARIGEQFTATLNSQLTQTDDTFYFCGVGIDPSSVGDGSCPAMEVEIFGIHTNNPELEGNAERLVEAEELRETAEQLNVALADIEDQVAGIEANADLERIQLIEDYIASDEGVLQCLALAEIGVDCVDYIRAQTGAPLVTGNDQVVVGNSQSGD